LGTNTSEPLSVMLPFSEDAALLGDS